MTEADYGVYKRFGVGCDFAISKKDSANRTSFSIAGKCLDNFLYFVDQRVGRWGANEIIEEFFSIQTAWVPEVFWVEKGQIWLALRDTLFAEMYARDIWLNIVEVTPIADKAARGRAFQKRMKARSCRFDKKASWYVEYEEEVLLFTGVSEATLDDQFDSSALVVKGFETFEVGAGDDQTDDEQEFDRESERLRGGDGRSAVTGY